MWDKIKILRRQKKQKSLEAKFAALSKVDGMLRAFSIQNVS
jgi:hypothetical protein